MYDTPFDMLVRSPVGPVLAALWGALWGSFLNVVIERLPRGQSLLRPGSHCFTCGEPVRFYDNVPILSYLVLRGRCRHCKTPFSPRYALVELLAAGLAVACYYHACRYGEGASAMRLAQFLAEFFFAAGLVAIAFIDIRTMIIPSAITYPMIVCMTGVAIALDRLPWYDALIGASAGYLFVFLVAEVYRLLRGIEGLGLGDGKLLAVLGGFLGWKSLPVILFLGSVQGLIVAIPFVLLGRSLVARHSYKGLTDEPEDAPETDGGAERGDPGAAGDADPSHEDGDTNKSSDRGADATVSTERADDEAPDEEAVPGLSDLRADAVPFGPFLALAGLEALFFGKPIVEKTSAILDQLMGLL